MLAFNFLCAYLNAASQEKRVEQSVIFEKAFRSGREEFWFLSF